MRIFNNSKIYVMFFSVLIMLFLFGYTASAETLTQLDGYILSNTNITVDTSFNSDLIIAKGVTLTIDPGVNVSVFGNVFVYGSINNRGTFSITQSIFVNNYNNFIYGNPGILDGKLLNTGHINTVELSTFYPNPKLEILSPIDGAVVSGNSVDIIFNSYPSLSYEVNGQTGIIPNSGQIISPCQLTLGENTISIKIIDPFGNISEISRTIISEPQTIVPVSGVSLDYNALTLNVGGNPTTLNVTITPSNATNKSISWSSSNDLIATVNNGVVTAASVGIASISAISIDGSKISTCLVTVVEGTIADSTPPVLNSVTVDKKTVSAGETVTVTIDATDDISGLNLHNSSWIMYDNPNHLTANHGKSGNFYLENGVIKAKIDIGIYDEAGEWVVGAIQLQDNAGNTYFVNKVNRDFSTASFIVQGTIADSTPPVLNSVTVDKKTVSAGETVTVTIDATDDISGLNLHNSSCIMYDNPSHLTANHGKSGNFYLENGVIKAKIDIGIYDEAGEWVVGAIQLQDNAGNTYFVNKVNRDFSNASFIVQGTTNTLESIEITTQPIKLSYMIGDLLDIKGLVVTGTYSDGTTKDETVTDTDITGFDSTAVAASQTLTITIGGKTTTFIVSFNSPIAVESISLNKSSLTMDIGNIEVLETEILPSNATNKNIIWSSTNLQIASVDADGKVTAVGLGTATIYVTTINGGMTASCLIIVPAHYVVIYNENGSTGGTVPVDSSTYLQQATVTVLGNSQVLIKSDYIFGGWNTAADGSGVDYGVGETFTIGTANMILYAKWILDTQAIEDFTTRFYKLCLGRNPDQSGLDYWVNLLTSGESSGAQLAQGFVFSNEFLAQKLSNTDFVNVMYRVFFNREPDVVGQTYWENQLLTGMNRYQALADFIGSNEFGGICADYGITQGDTKSLLINAFVNRFYNLCLNREPDAAGLAFWVDPLIAGENTGANIANGFVFSTEFVGRNLSTTDFIAVMYRAFFNREPDDGGQAYWLGMLGGGTSRLDVLKGFVSSAEFGQICSDYGIRVGEI